MLVDGVRGAICDTTWDDQDAEVACREMGHIGKYISGSDLFCRLLNSKFLANLPSAISGERLQRPYQMLRTCLALS